MMTKTMHTPHRERGAALFVGLIVMVVLTILGVSIMHVVTQQERMVRNMLNQNMAFQAAESALRAGEAEIVSDSAPFAPFEYELFGACVSTYRCLPATGGTPRWKSVSWETGSTNTAPIATNLPGTPRPPRYLIELTSGKPTFEPSLGCTPAVFRITAMGYGPASAEAKLQTIYRFKPTSC